MKLIEQKPVCLLYPSKARLTPKKHVWIDTDLNGITIDLEDWKRSNEWDNAIARIKVKSLEEAIEIIQIWLSGGKLDDNTQT